MGVSDPNRMPADFDAWKTGHWGDDDPANREGDVYDPRDEEPDDFNERRAAV